MYKSFTSISIICLLKDPTKGHFPCLSLDPRYWLNFRKNFCYLMGWLLVDINDLENHTIFLNEKSSINILIPWKPQEYSRKKLYFYLINFPFRVPILLSATSEKWFILWYLVVNKDDLIPPVPVLTRYKKEMGIKAFVKKDVAEIRIMDDKKSSEINALTSTKLCVRLNTLYVSFLFFL